MTAYDKKFRVFFGDSDLSMIFRIALPIFVDMMLNNIISTIHAGFVASAGEAVISAISLVNQVNSLICAVFISAASACMVVVSQLRGTGDENRARLVVGQSITFAAGGMGLVGIFFFIFPAQVMTLFFGTVEPSILSESIKYIRLLGISLPFNAVFNVCACSSRGYDNHKLPMYISVLGSIINVSLAFVFIKLLKLGIVGAGLAIIICRVIASTVFLKIFIDNKWISSFKESVKIKYSVIKSVLYLGFYSSSESMITSFAGTLKTGFLVPFGIAHITASSVIGTFSNLLCVPISVMSTLTVTLVAKRIGAKEYLGAKQILLKCIIYSFTMAVIVWLPAYFILPYVFPSYTDNPETLKLLSQMVLIYAIGNPTVAMFSSIIRQGFNAAGDARYPMIVSVICMLIFNLGGGYLLTVVLNMGVIGAAISAFASAFVKSLIYIFRYKSGKWEKKVLV